MKTRKNSKNNFLLNTQENIPSIKPANTKRNSRAVKKEISFIHEFEEVDCEKKRDTKMSYEEIIYDIITEIPHYFDLDHKFKDDMNIKDSKAKHYDNICIDKKKENNSKSVGRIKSIKDGIKIKSSTPCVNCKVKENKDEKEKDICMKLISACESKISSEKASFKYENEDNSSSLYSGVVIVTDFRIIFQFEDINFKVEDKLSIAESYFSIPLFCINRIEKFVDRKTVNKYNMEIITKDNRNIKLIIFSDELDFFYIVQKLCFPNDQRQFGLFTKKFFSHCSNLDEIDGWTIFDIEKEFKRQNVDFTQEKSRYRISRANDKYKICSTYPRLFIVPRFFSDEEIIDSSNFRTKNRLPILSWQYSKNKCCIWRSSQSKTGITQQRSNTDEKLLKMIMDYTDKLVIYDARPYLNALANKFKGAGFEIVENYQKCEIKFCEIDNIHSVKSSAYKLNTLLSSHKLKENKKFFSELEKTGWFDFISQIIKSSIDIANTIKNGSTVLIHCSDGWDRSSQLSSLAQIILDPFYRTLIGFIVLIEKEWLSFGHQFGLRNGLCPKELADIEASPIFTQWLDCVHQLLTQFPQAFEFNLDFLNFIASNVYSCLYGTFIYSSDKEREENEAKHKTLSIWGHVFNMQKKKTFLNPFYRHNFVKELIPSYSFYKLRLWEEYFFRYDLKENIIKLKDNNNVDQLDCENKNCEKNDILIKDYYKFFEQSKKNDMELIKTQYEIIASLGNIIKDMASVTNKHNLINELSPNSKQYIQRLDEIQISINGFNSNIFPLKLASEHSIKNEGGENNKIILLENYIKNIENK